LTKNLIMATESHEGSW